MKRVLSGIQPTGSVHIGNYLGALKNWEKKQSTPDNSIYCIVDLHAITIRQDPIELLKKVQELARILLAIGIKPSKSSLVLQSRVPEHAELAWMLTCVTPIGWLTRMTQFKAKSGMPEDDLEASEDDPDARRIQMATQKLKEWPALSKVFAGSKSIDSGLLQYPVLMAADILLYQADEVPVGDDQKQHVELTRDIAQRFNLLYKQTTFTMPETHSPVVGARIMGLDDPEKKMSKSEPGSGHAIALLDPPDVIRKKIMRATTDTKPGVDVDHPGAGIQNLLNIYQAFTELPKQEVDLLFSGMRYGDFKKHVAEAVIAGLGPIKKRYDEITVEEVTYALREGSLRAASIAQGTIQKVKRAMGLFTFD